MGWLEQNFYAFQLLGFALSLSLVCVLVVLDLFYSRVNVVPFTFQMFSIRERRLYMFDCDITFTPQAPVILVAAKWVVRAATVMVFAYFWQTAVFYQGTVPNDPFAMSWWEDRCSAIELVTQCFQHPSLGDIAFFWQFTSFLPTCDLTADEVGGMGGFLTCVSVLRLDTVRVATSLGVVFGLFHLIMNGFQFLLWGNFRFKVRWLPWVYLVLGLLMFVGSILWWPFADSSTEAITWFSMVMYIAFPVCFVSAFVAGRALNKVQRARQAQLQERAKLPLEHRLSFFGGHRSKQE